MRCPVVYLRLVTVGGSVWVHDVLLPIALLPQDVLLVVQLLSSLLEIVSCPMLRAAPGLQAQSTYLDTSAPPEGLQTTKQGLLLRAMFVGPCACLKHRTLLQTCGISKSAPRSEWPQKALIQVLRELMQESPKTVLAAELVHCSASNAEWWRHQQGYIRSTAAASMVRGTVDRLQHNQHICGVLCWE